MKTITAWLAVLVSLCTVCTVSAQNFGIIATNMVIAGVSHPAIVVTNAGGLSYSLEQSTGGASFAGVSGWFPTSIGGNPAFVRLATSQTGYYYRAVTSSNSVTYVSTSVPLVEGRSAIVNGNRQVTVVGPTNLTYTLMSSRDLVLWSAKSVGDLGQMVFIDPGLGEGVTVYKVSTTR